MDTTTHRRRPAFGRWTVLAVLAVTFAVAAPDLAAAGAAGARDSAGPGTATTPPAPIGTPRGLVPRTDTAHPRGLAATANHSNPACPGCRPPLLFHADLPLMGGLTATPGEATITPIYWAPSGYSFPSSYKAIIDGYLANVAAASGSDSNVFSVSEEYYQQLGSAPIQYLQYLVHAGTEVDVADPFPAQSPTTGCLAAAGLTACVNDAALRAEVHTAATAHGLAEDDTHLYMVFFPPGVQTCEGVGTANATDNPCSSNVYCAYHGGFFDTGGKIALYANEPYPDLNGCADGINGPQAPNGDAHADAAVSLVSHEANEAITDSWGTWFDASGNENGDECSYVYGTPLGSTGVTPGPGATGTFYNQTINGAHYYTQDEFSNRDYFAAEGDIVTPADPTVVHGCLQRPDAGSRPYVTASYVDLLGRPPTASRLTYWTTYLDHGGSRTTFIADLIGSSDHVGHVITGLYQTILGRSPSASGLAHWRQLVTSHEMTTAQVATTFYASAEYYAHVGGGAPSTWVTSLYHHILNRTPPASRVSYWTGRTASMGRASVARQLYQSGESRGDRVLVLYLIFLHRVPDAHNKAAWAATILTAGDDALVRHLAVSDEYAHLALGRFA